MDAGGVHPWTMEEQVNITPHFTRSEFGNPPVALLSNARRVCEALELLRKSCGKPIIITSGYRDEEKNRQVGGVALSQHVTALAADFRIAGHSSVQLSVMLEHVLEAAGVEWDQIIYYRHSRHLHLGMGFAERMQIFCGD